MDDRASRAEVLASVGERMVSHRTVRGIALEDAAEDARIEAERLAEAEAGELALTDDELRRLADALGIDVTGFFGGRVTPLAYLAGA